MRIYEELFIVKPDAPEEEVDGFVEQLRNQLTTAGATVDKVEKWGKRKLAYRVDKYREGSYVLLQFSANAFNPFNRTNFAVNGTVGNANFGRATGPQYGPRIITMVLRLYF